jgi:hydroxymethylpyrimidine pyrophosphatase-like HAD family hydrolase
VGSFDAVVTDLDGTVIRRDGTVSAATLHAAHILEERGVPLLAATARTPAGVDALDALSRYLTFAVCCSGAVGYVPATTTLAWCERIPGDVVTDLMAFLAQRLPSAGLAAFDGLQWRMTAAYQVMRPSGHKGPASVVPVAELAMVDPCAMVVGHPRWTAPELIAVLLEAGFDATRLDLNYAGPQFVEVTAAHVDKATGVLRAVRTIGVAPERVIAFGDMPIDIAMFSVLGHSVAMGNASEEVSTAAASQAACVEDDGFARTLSDLDMVPRGLFDPMSKSSEPPAPQRPERPGQAVVDRP